MSWAVILALGTVITAGIYLALSRDLFRCLIGLALLGNGINLMLFTSGRLNSLSPPIIPAGDTVLGATANPLAQALVLTAIVISFAMLCFSLILAIRIVQENRSDDTIALREAEPHSDDPLKPIIEDEP